MQPSKTLDSWLRNHADREHFLFCQQDLRALLPTLSEPAWKTLLSRMVSGGLLERVCRGIYIVPGSLPNDGLLLFHVAAYLRSNNFNYISLETVLSDTGVISQAPINHITLMSSGRSYTISCGRYGNIEFVHTNQKAADLAAELIYDDRRGLWRASTRQALRDMKRTHRSLDLVDPEVIHELV